jgi:hypothetical protein
MGLRFCTCAGRLNAAEEEKHGGCRTAGEGYALLRPTNELVPTRQHSGADGLASRCLETDRISLAQGNTKRNKISHFTRKEKPNITVYKICLQAHDIVA